MSVKNNPLKAKPIDHHSKDWWKQRSQMLGTYNNPTLPGFHFNYRTSYLLRNPKKIWGQIKAFFNQFLFMYQRARYGYSEQDWWSIDWYLLDWLPDALRKYKWGIGWPGEGVTSHDGTTLETIEQYHAIIDQIADGLEAGKAWANFEDLPSDQDEWEKVQDERKKQFNEAFDLLKYWFFSFWD